MEKLKKTEKNCMRRILENVLDTNIFYELEKLTTIYFDKSLSKDMITDYVTFFDSQELINLSSERDLLKKELIEFIAKLHKTVVNEINSHENKTYIQIFRLYRVYRIFMPNTEIELEFKNWRSNNKLRFSIESELFINTSPFKEKPKKWLEWFSLIK